MKIMFILILLIPIIIIGLLIYTKSFITLLGFILLIVAQGIAKSKISAGNYRFYTWLQLINTVAGFYILWCVGVVIYHFIKHN